MFDVFQAALDMFDGLSSSTWAAIFVGLFTVFYFILKLYRHANRYQNIDDNEILKLKLKAARLKQQEIYLEHLKQQQQQAEAKSNEEESTDENLNRKNGSTNNNKKKNDDDTLLNDYFPLASGGAHYRPARKRACGPCGGGGCG